MKRVDDRERPASEQLVGEVVLVLIPFGLVFASLALPSTRIGPAVISVYHVLLLVEAMVLLRGITWSVRRGPLSTGVVALLGAWALGLMAMVMFAKGASLVEVKELKNQLAPAVMMTLVLGAYLRSPARARRAILAISIGATIAIVSVYARLGRAMLGVRALDRFALTEMTGLNYIFLGVAGAYVLVTAWVLRAGRRKLAVVLGVIGALATISAGTRAAILGLLGFGVLVLMRRWFSVRVIGGMLFVAIIISSSMSLIPGVLLDFFPGTSGPTHAEEGAERLTEGKAYTVSLRGRVEDWNRMLYDHSMRSVLVGLDYRMAMLRSHNLSHPHNMFLWSRLLGGLPVTVLLILGFGTWGREAWLGYAAGREEIRDVTSVNLFLFIELMGTVLTNSWVAGIQLLVGVGVGLTAFVAMERRKA